MWGLGFIHFCFVAKIGCVQPAEAERCIRGWNLVN